MLVLLLAVLSSLGHRIVFNGLEGCKAATGKNLAQALVEASSRQVSRTRPKTLSAV